MFRFFREFAKVILDELRWFYEEHLKLQDPRARLEDQLRILYGSGEIDRKRFFQLRFKLHQGLIWQGDMNRLRRQAALSKDAEGKLEHHFVHPQIAHSLKRVYLDRGLLEEARFETDQLLKALDSEAGWLREQAGQARQNAKLSLPDEAGARSYLEIRQNLLGHAQALDRRIERLRDELRRMDQLEVELRTYEAELKLLESQEYLAGVRLSIVKDLGLDRH